MSSQPLTSKRLATLVAGLFILVGLSWYRLSQPLPGSFHTIHGETMGTTYTVKVPHEFGEGLYEEIEVVLEGVNAGMSTYREDSELTRFNQSETDPFKLSQSTYNVIKNALELSERSNGAFDITVGPVVNAYGFGPYIKIKIPSQEELGSLRPKIGYQHLSLNEADLTLQKDQPDIYCDLSAIAKGHGVDQVATLLESKNIPSYFIEIGGEVRCRGVKRNDTPWYVGIEKPISGTREIHRIIPLKDAAMATSGSYRNYLEANGTRVSHTIDPRTARPITHNVVSVTVIHESCEWADAYATALLVMGKDEGMAFAESENLPVLFIEVEKEGEFRLSTSSQFGSYFAENNIEDAQ